MATEYRTGRYGTRWTSLGSIPSSLVKYVEYDRRRLAITFYFATVIGASRILVVFGRQTAGFSYEAASALVNIAPHYTLRRYEVGGIVCGEVWALMASSLGTLTIVEYIDYSI